MKGEKMPIFFNVKLLYEGNCYSHLEKKSINIKLHISMNDKHPLGPNHRFSIPNEEFKVQKVNTKKPISVGPFGREALRFDQRFPNHIYLTFEGPLNQCEDE